MIKNFIISLSHNATKLSESIRSHGNIEKWANAEDDGGNLPFYKKDNDGKYLIDVDYLGLPILIFSSLVVNFKNYSLKINCSLECIHNDTIIKSLLKKILVF